MSVEHAELLRRMAISDEGTLSRVLGGSCASDTLDERTAALVRIAALIALDAGEPSYDAAIDAAHLAGAEDEEILGVATAIGAIVGAVKVDAALPMLPSDLESQRNTA
jgi:alkylhydroperoxidase/carboxymuconolactone decarboxylase family protein YurZ